MRVEKLYIGGWFQRTTLHLSEIHDFLKHGTSPLPLDAKKLSSLHAALGIESMELRAEDLECVRVKVRGGITLNVFEDGLMLFSKDADNDLGTLKASIEELTAYYEKTLSPAIRYLFSLGAPVPKELANIKTIYPYFVVVHDAEPEDVQNLLATFGQEEYFEIRKPTFDIYRGDKLYIVHAKGEKPAHIERFIQEQIFIREFKGQLHHYLNLHRTIWERIADVKEKGEIRGKDVPALSAKIESYAKTINLIEARINQMDAYLETRESIVARDKDMKRFADVLQFKHEKLRDTLAYVKEIWSMTKNYVDSANELFGSIQAQSTESSVENLTIVTTVGVGATLIGLFSQEIPEFTVFGVWYFFILVFVGWAANRALRVVGERRMYEIEDVELSKDIR